MFFERDTDGFSFEDGGTPNLYLYLYIYIYIYIYMLDYMFFERDTDGFSFEDGGTLTPPTSWSESTLSS